MALFTGTAGVDAFAGSDTEADTFRFTALTLAGTDIASGGVGGFTDILALTAAGTFTAAMLAGLSGIERVTLSAGTNALTLTAAFVAGAEGQLDLRGSTGNDSIDASAVVDPLRGLRFGTGTGGNDVFLGGAGADTVLVQGAGTLLLPLGQGDDTVESAIALLDAADAIAGGAGTDRLVLASTGILAALALAGLSEIEEISLATGGITTLGLTTTLVAQAGGTLTIIGNGDAGLVDASFVEAGAVVYLAGAGADSFRGGAGADVYAVSGAATGNLGGGRDTLRLDSAAASGLASVQGGAGVDTVEITGKGSWNLTGLGGFEDVVLATNATVQMSATTGQRLEGSTGNDVITLGATEQTVLADLGNDTVILPVAFVSGAVLSGGGQTTRDTLRLQGAGTYNLLSDALVTGFERIELGLDGAGSTVILGNVAAEMRLKAGATVTMGINPGQSVIGSPDADTIRLGAAGQFVDANGGDDIILGSIAALTGGAMVNGGTGSDRVVLTDGGSIDLQLVGSVNVETYELTAATQIRAGTARPETILGSAGADDIALRVAGSSASAGAGNDTLRAQGAGVTLQGGDGEDVFLVTVADQTAWSGAANTLNGGTVPNQGDVLEVQLAAGVQTTLDLTQHNITGIDRVRVVGSDPLSSLVVTVGNAMASTADGNDGGSFGDLWIEATVPVLAAVTVNASSLTGANSVRVDQSNNSFFLGNDSVTGGAAADLVRTAGGNDTIRGNAGGDVLEGGDGQDSIDGGANDDLLGGDGGNDTIVAGDGADDVTGGLGGDSITLTEAVAALDRVRFDNIADGSIDINTSVSELTADRITGFNPATDQVILSRTGLGLGAGAVQSVAANAAWNVSAAAIFIFDSADTLSVDNFGDILQIGAAINGDAGTASGSSAGRTVAFFVSNLETSAPRRTGAYVWTDTDGDSVLETTDVVRLLGVFDATTSGQFSAANVLIG